MVHAVTLTAIKKDVNIMKKIKKISSIVLSLILFALTFSNVSMAGESLENVYVDDLEREVVLEKKPERAAVLLGSFASAWVLAGGGIVAAADDAWEDFDLGLSPDCVNLGNTSELSLELLIASEPDLVIGSARSDNDLAWESSLGKMGIPVMYFHVEGFDDYLRMMDTFTDITGRKDLFEEYGLNVQNHIKEIINKVEEKLDGGKGPEVLLLRIAKTSVKAKGSKGTVLGEMLKNLYCINISDGSDLLDNLTLEAIVAADPEYIFVVYMGDNTEAADAKMEEVLSGNPAWAGLSAVKNNKVFYMDKHLYNFKPNQLWGIAYEQLAEIIYGDLN